MQHILMRHGMNYQTVLLSLGPCIVLLLSVCPQASLGFGESSSVSGSGLNDLPKATHLECTFQKLEGIYLSFSSS